MFKTCSNLLTLFVSSQPQPTFDNYTPNQMVALAMFIKTSEDKKGRKDLAWRRKLAKAKL